MSKLLALPDELLYSSKSVDFSAVFNHLDANDLKNVRWVCRRLRDASETIFLSTFFSTLAVSIDSNGISRLSKITRNRSIARAVKTVKFMFDDMTTGDIYYPTLKQLQQNYTVELLAASFSRLENCDTFLYALQNHDDAVVEFWRSLFRTHVANFPENDVEEITREWMSITLDAMFSSRIELKHLIVDDHVSTIRLPPCWLPYKELQKLHPGRLLDLNTLGLWIQLSTDARQVEEIVDCFKILDRHTQRLFVQVEKPEGPVWNASVRDSLVNLQTAIALRGGLHEIVIDVPFLNLQWLQTLAKQNQGGLKSLKIKGLVINAFDILNFVDCIESITKKNPALALIDLGRHCFDWMTQDGANARIAMSIRDDRPHAYGALLLGDKIAKLRLWAKLAELD